MKKIAVLCLVALLTCLCGCIAMEPQGDFYTESVYSEAPIFENESELSPPTPVVPNVRCPIVGTYYGEDPDDGRELTLTLNEDGTGTFQSGKKFTWTEVEMNILQLSVPMSKADLHYDLLITVYVMEDGILYDDLFDDIFYYRQKKIEGTAM